MENWKTWFGVACWVLWYRRNNEIFNKERSKDDSVMEISRRVHEILYNLTVLHKSGLETIDLGDTKEKWEAPEASWFKHNSDGAC